MKSLFHISLLFSVNKNPGKHIQWTSDNEKQNILQWRKDLGGSLNDKKKIPLLKKKFKENHKREISTQTYYRIFKDAKMKETGENEKSEIQKKTKKKKKSNEDDVDTSKVQQQIAELQVEKARIEKELKDEESKRISQVTPLAEILNKLKEQIKTTENEIDKSRSPHDIAECKAVILQKELDSQKAPPKLIESK